MLLYGFDHTIVLVDSITEADKNFSELGFEVIRRPDAGESTTDIRIITLEDGSYIELFAFKEPSQPNAHRWWPLAQKGEAWLDYSVHCDSVADYADALKAKGLPILGPRTAGKSLQDGRAWKVGVVDAGFGIGRPAMPFFLEDLASRNIRVTPSRNTGLSTVGVTVVTSDIDTAGGALAVAFGGGVKVRSREHGDGALLFEFGGCWVELVDCGSHGSAMAEHVKRHGESVYEVTLGTKGVTKPGDGQLFPLQKTGGARLKADNRSTIGR